MGIYEEEKTLRAACLCWPATNNVSVREIKESKRTKWSNEL